MNYSKQYDSVSFYARTKTKTVLDSLKYSKKTRLLDLNFSLFFSIDMKLRFRLVTSIFQSIDIPCVVI